MSNTFDSLYEVQRKDIPKTGIVFAEAFRDDPVWKKVMAGRSDRQWQEFFKSPALYCRKYGKLYAPSENLEGLAGWVSGDMAEMSLWRGIRSGSLGPAFRMGFQALKDLKTIFDPLEAARRKNMRGRAYIYLIILGVSPEYQGQGYGGKLLRAVIEESRTAGLPIYLETAAEKNVRMYEKFGFKLLGQIMHPIIDVPQWEMLREPSDL